VQCSAGALTLTLLLCTCTAVQCSAVQHRALSGASWQGRPQPPAQQHPVVPGAQHAGPHCAARVQSRCAAAPAQRRLGGGSGAGRGAQPMSARPLGPLFVGDRLKPMMPLCDTHQAVRHWLLFSDRKSWRRAVEGCTARSGSGRRSRSRASRAGPGQHTRLSCRHRPTRAAACTTHAAPGAHAHRPARDLPDGRPVAELARAQVGHDHLVAPQAVAERHHRPAGRGRQAMPAQSRRSRREREPRRAPGVQVQQALALGLDPPHVVADAHLDLVAACPRTGRAELRAPDGGASPAVCSPAGRH